MEWSDYKPVHVLDEEADMDRHRECSFPWHRPGMREVYVHEEIGLVWQVDTFGKYYAVDVNERVVRYHASRNNRGFWTAREPSSGTVVITTRRSSDLFRVVELHHLARQGREKWHGLTDRGKR